MKDVSAKLLSHCSQHFHRQDAWEQANAVLVELLPVGNQVLVEQSGDGDEKELGNHQQSISPSADECCEVHEGEVDRVD